MKIIDEKYVEKLPKYIKENGCWIYAGCIHHTGYGIMCTSAFGKKRNIKVNRIICYVYHGLDINNPKQFACHKNICLSRACINPDHLYVGDNSSNQLDAVEAGTSPFFKKEFCIRGHPRIESEKECKICNTERARGYKLERKNGRYKPRRLHKNKRR